MFKIKKDNERVGTIVYTLVLALLLKLILDNLKMAMLSSIPSWVMLGISVLAAIIIAQKLTEDKIDIKEGVVFLAAIFIINFLVKIIVPSVGDLNIFNAMMTTTVGMIATLMSFIITIPISVIVADMVTDRWH